MKVISKISIVFVLLAGFSVTNAFAGDASSQENGRRRHGPPPEAYAACEGKSAGDKAEFVSPRGDTVTGTCEQEGDRLVLRPDHPRRGPEGKTGQRQRGGQE